MKDSFLIYCGMYEPIKDLSDEKFGKLMKAIFHFQITGEEVKIDDDIKIAFGFFKNQFIQDNKKYDKIVETRKEQGRKGGLAKARFAKQKLAKSSKSSLNDTVTVIDTVTDIVIKKENIKEKVFEFENKYPKGMLEEFLNYRTEKGKTGKERRESEKFFEVGRRLATWYARAGDKRKQEVKRKTELSADEIVRLQHLELKQKYENEQLTNSTTT